jgi:autotransporter strand-loop-strand O-heptosyltransferase
MAAEVKVAQLLSADSNSKLLSGVNSAAQIANAIPDDIANPFVLAPAVPTQVGDRGIHYDFNHGARVLLPEGKWRVTLKDELCGNILYQSEVGACTVASARKYFVPFSIKIEDATTDEVVLFHEMDLINKTVLVQLPVGTLGDSIAWFSYLERFRLKHGCNLICSMSELISPLFSETYPEIKFITKKEAADVSAYATYYIGLFFRGDTENQQPSDYRLVGLHKTAAHILGVDTRDEAPKVKKFKRTIKEKYVCIGIQSSTQCKYWNNPVGWREVVKSLKERGYRVLCIDKELMHGSGLVWNHIPYGAEDFTGALPLIERAALLQHADFFVGVSSGLSWLAWACQIPVVMISGMTHPINEFDSPYRIHNTLVCNSCWNDTQIIFNHFDFLWCPRHAGTPRQFECSRMITPEFVMKIIDRCIANLPEKKSAKLI